MVIGNSSTDAARNASSNIINLTSYNANRQAIVCYGNRNSITVKSNLDGRSGAQGAYYALEIYGNYNTFDIDVIDSSTWQVRGVAVRSGATENYITRYAYVNTADPISDVGTATQWNLGLSMGNAIASSATIIIPRHGAVFSVTGTTNISAISGTGGNKRLVTLVFADVLNVVGGASLVLTSNMVTRAGATLTLMYDGSVWREVGRNIPPLLASTTVGTGGGLGYMTFDAVATLSGATTTITLSIPAGYLLIGAQLRVDTAITSGDGATSWSAAFSGGSTTSIATGQAFTKNTKVDFNMVGELTTGTTNVAVTPNSGTFSGGAVRAICYCKRLYTLANA